MIDIKTVEVPKSPGVYKFINFKKQIIYVGKSKDLSKRVRSYFTKKIQNKKILNMIREVTDISFVISDNEHDALLLENSLIKKNKPKYNILLRDDKTYPWICIKKERFPRIFLTRKTTQDGSEYFGPYTNVKLINKLLNVIKTLYPIRTENYNFSDKKINDKKNKIYLKSHCKNGVTLILGFRDYPIQDEESYITEEQYMKNIDYARDILSGKFNTIKKRLKEEMSVHSINLEFEESQIIKEKIQLLENYKSKSIIVNNQKNDLDVFGIVDDEKSYYVNYMKIVNGTIVSSDTFKLGKKIKDKSELRQIIFNIRSKYNSHKNNIISNIKLDDILSNDINSHVPRLGEKKKLIDMSIKNTLFFKKNLYNEKKERKSKRLAVLIELKNKLNLKNIPFHVECYDISNIQGSNTVASLVTFQDGYPNKKEYRRFKIRDLNKPDDFESMKQVIRRRYKRVIDEGLSLPDLIIVDGGKGQLSSACEALKELDLYNKVNIIGLAKKLEEVYFPNDSMPILLSKKSYYLKLLQQIRNEAHRFAINYHKDLRSKNFLKSSIETIKGIGEKTRLKLINKFGSLDKLKGVNNKDIEDVIGKKKTDAVIAFLKNKN
ncbi:MAG: excinuclease ABC subunit C [Marinoscillum sp.]|nr:excinuclease ABC subunit C [Marinoscillum sp.]OUX27086.1 MAG: excinuclease ABC subunit C [Flammeovirgaceae bacterium TMED262]